MPLPLIALAMAAKAATAAKAVATAAKGAKAVATVAKGAKAVSTVAKGEKVASTVAKAAKQTPSYSSILPDGMEGGPGPSIQPVDYTNSQGMGGRGRGFVNLMKSPANSQFGMGGTVYDYVTGNYDPPIAGASWWEGSNAEAFSDNLYSRVVGGRRDQPPPPPPPLPNQNNGIKRHLYSGPPRRGVTNSYNIPNPGLERRYF